MIKYNNHTKSENIIANEFWEKAEELFSEKNLKILFTQGFNQYNLISNQRIFDPNQCKLDFDK